MQKTRLIPPVGAYDESVQGGGGTFFLPLKRALIIYLGIVKESAQALEKVVKEN